MHGFIIHGDYEICGSRLCVITLGKFIGFDMNETCEISLFMFGLLKERY